MPFRCSTAFSILTVPAMPTTPIISLTAPVPFTMPPMPVLIPVSLAWSVSAHISASASLISSPVSLRSFRSPAIARSTTWREFISVAEFIAWIVIHMQEVTVLASRASVSVKETCKKNIKKVIRIEKKSDASRGCLRCFFSRMQLNGLVSVKGWQIFGERLKSQVAKPQKNFLLFAQVTIKAWPQPETAHEKTLAPRVSDAVTKTKLVKLWDRLLYPGRTKNKPGS